MSTYGTKQYIEEACRKSLKIEVTVVDDRSKLGVCTIKCHRDNFDKLRRYSNSLIPAGITLELIHQQ